MTVINSNTIYFRHTTTTNNNNDKNNIMTVLSQSEVLLYDLGE